jgi:diaminobutyrate-2-oxoglutarate transaminase
MLSNDIFGKVESSVQSYARSFPGMFDRAVGAEIWTSSGRRYLDFLAGAGSLNYGHNNPVIKRALIQHIERDAITHSLDLNTLAKQEFLTAMHDIVLEPRGFDHVIQFTGPTGTNAVEAALKIARKVTGRTNVICFTNGFHGVTMGALAATGNSHHRNVAGVPLLGTTVMPYERYLGDDIDTIDVLDRMVSDPSSGVDTPAAVLVETIQGEGGINTASNGWLKRLQTLCRNRGILLIVDDIQAGCGRTGTFFSFEPAGIIPDIVTLSKSLSGYGVPFSVVLIRRSYDQWLPGEHNGTFRGNNHAFVAATTALRHFWQTPEFAEEVRDKGDWLGQRLHEIADRFAPHIVEVRGRGMMRGLCCADPQRAAAVTARAFDNGLIIERSGSHDEVIKFLMPLTISRGQLAEGLDILERALLAEYGNRSSAAVKLASVVTQ